MTITEEVNALVRDALAEGITTLEVHHKAYIQHLLREHPNVCRRALAGTGIYRLHTESCNCPPDAQLSPVIYRKGNCCGLAQAPGSECMMCDEVVM